MANQGEARAIITLQLDVQPTDQVMATSAEMSVPRLNASFPRATIDRPSNR